VSAQPAKQTFDSWQEALANAKRLLAKGWIGQEEFDHIAERAKESRGPKTEREIYDAAPSRMGRRSA
jgi:hypothetical protein